MLCMYKYLLIDQVIYSNIKLQIEFLNAWLAKIMLRWKYHNEKILWKYNDENMNIKSIKSLLFQWDELTKSNFLFVVSIK